MGNSFFFQVFHIYNGFIGPLVPYCTSVCISVHLDAKNDMGSLKMHYNFLGHFHLDHWRGGISLFFSKCGRNSTSHIRIMHTVSVMFSQFLSFLLFTG